jgi:hypothetical protein
MRYWWARHPRLAWAAVIACSIAGSAAGVVIADALYGKTFFTWTVSFVQWGFSLGGSLLGAAAGITIVLATGGRHGRR